MSPFNNDTNAEVGLSKVGYFPDGSKLFVIIRILSRRLSMPVSDHDMVKPEAWHPSIGPAKEDIPEVQEKTNLKLNLRHQQSVTTSRGLLVDIQHFSDIKP
jgi:hypothetical protein